MVISSGIGMLWPEYREAMRVMFQERQYHALTTLMLMTNLCLFAVAGILVGYVSTVLASGRTPALVVAALLLIYAVIDHYVLLWDKLPHWYNLVVPLVIAGFVSLGCHINSFSAAKTDNKKDRHNRLKAGLTSAPERGRQAVRRSAPHGHAR